MAMPDMQAPAPTEGAPSNAPTPGGGANGQDMKPMLLKVLKKVKETAEGAGLDFEALVEEVSGGGESSPAEQATPRPPSPEAMASPALMGGM